MNPTSAQAPRKVAIIGGGCAAMAAAWELTGPEQMGRYDVTVYQLGWRLGGKGASGRGASGRIEEHGLHLWMGHYDNAFRLMQEVYAELRRDPSHPLASWRQAFVPDPYVGLTDPSGNGEWQRLMAHFPPMPGTPGEPRPSGALTTAADYISRAVQLLLELIHAARSVDELAALHKADSAAHKSNGGGIIEAVEQILAIGQIATLTGLKHAIGTLGAALEQLPAIPSEPVQKLIDRISAGADAILKPLINRSTTARYLWEIIDIVLATLRGSIRFGLATNPRGFEVIDDYDIRDWLQLNGVSEQALNSAFVRGLYDLAFAYEDGNPNLAGIAAGQGLRGGLRMFFQYREALFWKMQGGMGDIVFAPMYEALTRRGVKFEFFHKLTNVGMAGWRGPDTPHVASLTFDVQAHITDGGSYEPLLPYDGVNCWPSEPIWSQLQDGYLFREQGVDFESFWDRTAVAEKTLHLGDDFDFVVLGISVAAIPYACPELLANDARWQRMVENVKTVPTQALQLWLKEDLETLGWREEAPNLSAFVEPFDTWADMSHLVEVESWPVSNAEDAPKTIAYFCNVLPCPAMGEGDLLDDGYPWRYLEQVRENAIRFMDRDLGVLWPNAADANGFRWSLLANGTDREDANGPDQIDTQYLRANVCPTDRYVLALPGTLRHRISPLDATYDNLTIAGDWTDCGFNVGCVEAAVMSGRLASHALSLYPRLEDIDGYDHP